MMEYHRNESVDIRIARIFNTYGPRLNKNDGRVISNFIVAALKNDPITIYGEGNQTRSFCYVDDQVRGLIKLMNSNYNLPINIGNPHEITIQQAATLIKNLIPESTSVIEHRDLPADDPMQRKPDITKAQKILGWNPEVDLQYGLLETIQYFKHLLENNMS